MRYLRLISGLCLLASCAGPYKNLRQSGNDGACLDKFRPAFRSELYNTQVNVLHRHFSGLLLIKTMPDSSVRIVFSNEMGVSLFDFSFSKTGTFTVFSVIPQMNRKAVINTLRQDFELLLMQDLHQYPVQVLEDKRFRYFRYSRGKSFDYYITSKDCNELVRIEKASRRKVKVSMMVAPLQGGIPDTIGITHRNFNFNIGLKKLQR